MRRLAIWGNLKELEVQPPALASAEGGMRLTVTEEQVLDAPISTPDAPGDDIVRTAARPLRAAMVATWPLEIDEAFEGRHSRDPWVAIVRESIID
jgi:hypothetical protein